MMSSKSLTRRALPVLSLCSKHYKELIKFAWYSQEKKTAEFVKPQKRKGVIERPRHFVDYVKVTVHGGNGGNGMMSFSSLPNLEWAGPDGGNGGNGGHVIFKASHNAKSLAHLLPVIIAPKGIKGKTRQRDGKNAPHLTVQVPFGTVVKAENGRVLASLDDEETMFIAARGGAGGKGNYFFLSNENRAPTMKETGGTGQERELHVELKTMAHAGLVGFPNAGKSSLLRSISRAQPKVSPYPFTTLNPHIGMVMYDDYRQLAIADIPGLIPGSHLNKGMGHSFLRHIERCLCLVYVIDLALERPWEQLKQLRFELNQYKDGLADRPALLVANKIDLPEAQDRLDALKSWLKNEGRKNKNESRRVTSMRENEIRIECGGREEKIMNDGDGLYRRSDHSINSYEERIDIESKDNFCDNDETMKYNVNSEDNSSDDLELKKMNFVDMIESESIVVLGVSAKRKVGISDFLHHLRVIYDTHESSKGKSETDDNDDRFR